MGCIYPNSPSLQNIISPTIPGFPYPHCLGHRGQVDSSQSFSIGQGIFMSLLQHEGTNRGAATHLTSQRNREQSISFKDQPTISLEASAQKRHIYDPRASSPNLSSQKSREILKQVENANAVVIPHASKSTKKTRKAENPDPERPEDHQAKKRQQILFHPSSIKPKGQRYL